jgi:acetoin utilization protein AcuB
MKLREILDPNPVTISPDESAAVAWDRMHTRGVDHMVVLEENRVVGMLSRNDLGGPAGGTRRRMGRRVAELMRREVVTATPETSVKRASMLMRRHGIGCLPVITRDRLTGIVTVSDLLALLEKELST